MVTKPLTIVFRSTCVPGRQFISPENFYTKIIEMFFTLDVYNMAQKLSSPHIWNTFKIQPGITLDSPTLSGRSGIIACWLKQSSLGIYACERTFTIIIYAQGQELRLAFL